jgi:CHAT domain-containing protein/predicted negative regulator of RcsB-dependent stress response
VSPAQSKQAPARQILDQVATLADDASRKKFFSRHRRLVVPEFARHLTEAVVSEGRIDRQRALGLAEAALFLSRRLRKKNVLGLSLRAKGNALNLAGKNQEALDLYQQALKVFESLDDLEQIARTLTNSLQALILLSEYDRAFASADRARKILAELGDSRRLARLENNVGNIYHRQDRFEEALACYERAYQQLLPYGDSEELVTALSNMSMCLITLNDFARALAAHERVRSFCGDNKMPLLRAQADYNIAYLYYLRGEHSRAIEMLHAARRRCESSGDRYHFALCHLDLAEIYLELNLSAEARDMAHEGQLQFQKLGMVYEEAKCQAYEAMASSQLGKVLRSLELFAEARAKFVREKNLVWPSLVDLYEALVLFNEGRVFESRRLCLQAASFFDNSFLPAKAVLCHLLLARLSLWEGNLAHAREECNRAFHRLARIEAPILHHPAHFLFGEIQQMSGDIAGAYESYQQARRSFETLRSGLRSEELKISFMKDRLEVYERLVELCLGDPARPNAARESFGYIELAKSRSLAELLTRARHSAPADASSGQSGLVRRIREMREELNWYYHRIEQEQLRADEPSPQRIERLQKEALAHENELLRVLREIPSAESNRPSAPGSGFDSLEDVRASLPTDATLIEYFSLRDNFVAAVVTRESLEIIPLTPVSRVSNLIRMLDFQISKFRLGADYIRAFEESLLAAAQLHLQELYRELFSPLADRIHARHLVIVPHGVLHYLPFHALFDGERHLIDSFTISYAPSAAVFALCQRAPRRASDMSLILGVPDARAPFIDDEVQSIARALPNSELILGAEAAETALREKGPSCRLIHIATHGQFRRDNPLFSGIRLGAGYLTLYDLYQLRLGADLVTLSGCATGMNVAAAGDELIGLVRGFLHAGAHSLLLTLWDVQDRSTSDFMIRFYHHLESGSAAASAIQASMQELRSQYRHPYYWAPFILAGRASQP